MTPIQHAHLFQRIVDRGCGFIIGPIELAQCPNTPLVEGAEYLLFHSNRRFELAAQQPIQEPGEWYHSSSVSDLLRQEIWTKTADVRFITCRVIPLDDGPGNTRFLLYSAFEHAPFPQSDPCGDFYFWKDGQLTTHLNPPSSRGENPTTLLRHPIWQISSSSNECYAIEPNSSTLREEINEGSNWKVAVYEGRMTTEQRDDFVKAKRPANPDVYRSSGWDDEYMAVLSLMRKALGTLHTPRIRSAEEVKQHEELMRRCIVEAQSASAEAISTSSQRPRMR